MNRSTESSFRGSSLRSLTQLFFVFGLFSCFVFAAYLQRGRFDQLFLFDAPDTPPVPGAFYPGPLGVHTFGDFLQPLWQSRLTPSPFIAGYSSYLPASNGLFWLLSWIPFWTAFGILVLTSLSTLLMAFWNVNPNENAWGRTQLLVWGVLLTYPLLSALDRGNIQSLTVGLVVLGIYLSRRQHLVFAGVCLGLAIAFKAYPVLFLILFLKKRNWISTISAIATSALATVIPLLLFDGGVTQNIRALLHNLGSSQSELSSLSVFTNSSLEAFALSLKTLGLVSAADSVKGSMSVIIGVLFLLLVITCSVRGIEALEISLVISAFCTLSIGFSAGYVLMIFLIPCWFIYEGRSQLSNRWLLFYSSCIAALFMPKQIPLKFWIDAYRPDIPSLASFLNPLLMLLLIGAIAISSCKTVWSSHRLRRNSRLSLT